MQIFGCVNVYQDAVLLEDCLKELRLRVDRVVVVDGPYKAFPHHGLFLSDDGTLEVANRLADVVITRTVPWEDEVIKRNAYLVGDVGDWYFVVDADEMVQGEIRREMLVPEAKGYQIKISKTFKNDRAVSTVMRLFQHTPGIQYKYVHSLLCSDSGFIHPEKMPVIDGVSFRHRRDERSEQRMQDKGEYYRWLQEHERGARKRFKL